MTNFTLATYKANGDQILLDSEGNGYLYLQSKLNFSQTDLLKYIYLDRATSSVKELTAGFQGLSLGSVVQVT